MTPWRRGAAPAGDAQRESATGMNDASSTQGWAICIGAGVLALLFVIGVLNGSYLALAIPVGVLTLFVLGLAGWVGYTIATVRVEPTADPALGVEPPANSAEAPADPGPKPDSDDSAG
jgi:hypothetical protein